MATTGSLIRARRRELGLKQTDLARLAGTDRSTVSRAETGARQAATLSLLSMAKLARALGVTVDSLVGDDLYGKGAS
jgi:transcriptional regulator with XRE-family HTH domain